MKIEKFEDLEVWQEARELRKFIFKITSEERFSQDYIFKDQIRRAGGSVIDNIAEGFGRGGNKEFINFLSIEKAPMTKSVLNHIEPLILNTFQRKHIKTFLSKQKKSHEK
ncbi:MAG: four helix bundle protein [Bacteroidales bacterium]|nr:four helix bundle protein [Saprospiraceae bacterium]MCF8381567.1 four helix bundle protein [Bacteroidales bacterium]